MDDMSLTWFYRHKHSSSRWFQPMWLIWFKVMMIKSQVSGEALKMFKAREHHQSTWRYMTCYTTLSFMTIMSSFQVPRWILTLLRIWLTNPCTGLIDSGKDSSKRSCFRDSVGKWLLSVPVFETQKCVLWSPGRPLLLSRITTVFWVEHLLKTQLFEK